MRWENYVTQLITNIVSQYIEKIIYQMSPFFLFLSKKNCKVFLFNNIKIKKNNNVIDWINLLIIIIQINQS
jgi:hypothetical protein